MNRRFSYRDEERYYRPAVTELRPYEHLGQYLACFTEPGQLFRGKRVLEIGAGECLYARLLSGSIGARQVVALELFPHRMRLAARANAGSPLLSFIGGDSYRLPFADGSFDAVLGVGVLHHLPELEKVVGEIRRVLVPGGSYAGYEPNGFNAWVFASYYCGHRSRNEYVLWPWKFRGAFADAGFSVFTRYFWARFPSLKNRFLGTNIGIVARRDPETA